MNTNPVQHFAQPSLRMAQPLTLTRPQASLPQRKFTPASRHARLQSWQQRMKRLFGRQSY